MYSSITVYDNPSQRKSQILTYIGAFRCGIMLDSNNGVVPVTGINYDFIAAAGIHSEFNGGNSLNELQNYLAEQQIDENWVFGYFSYDMKNEIEKLSSKNRAYIAFPELHFFSPEHIITSKNGTITVLSKSDPVKVWDEIISTSATAYSKPDVTVAHLPKREQYNLTIQQILSEIHYGNIYELNFCHQVELETGQVIPTTIYSKLCEISPNPFSAYYHVNKYHLICASPERFVAKIADQLISQPIKGTSARSENSDVDERNKALLKTSEKERSENVMIVDLVRNDFSKIAKRGSVKVDELFGIYSFKRSHQLISTVSCRMLPDTKFIDVIKSVFPMGSMTGAPKINAMKLIDKFENFKRGLFSGTVGYIAPNGDFDFNVVIRSIQYDEASRRMSVAAGGAITAKSEPEKEYDETILKMTPQFLALDLNMEEIANFKTTTSNG
jgi:para-aminobenzoate synthetase component I